MRLLRSVWMLYRRQPAFAVTSSASIALGMSLAVAVFGVVDAVLFRPLPFLRADRLVTIYVPNAESASGGLSLLDAIQREGTLIARAATYSFSRRVVGRSGEARTLVVAQVSHDFFDVMGVRPVLGAGFDNQSDARGGRAAVISHSMWSAQLGGDPSVVGRRIVVGGQERFIVGVMPKTFDFPGRASVWLPTISGTTRSISPYSIVARLSDNASLEAAKAEVYVLYRRITALLLPPKVEGPQLMLLRRYLVANLLDQLQLWIAIAVLVVILCAVNFATMAFARGMAKRHEIALRRALGASSRRVTFELVTEAASLAVVGGILAIPLAWWLLSFADVLLADSFIAIPRRIDWLNAGLGVVATAIVGIAFAALPAIDAAMVDIRAVMQTGSGGSTSRHKELRSRRALVGFQVTLALTATALVTALVYADRRYQQAEIRVDYSRLLMANIFSVDTSLGPIDLRPLIDQTSAVAGIETAAAFSACDFASAATSAESRQSRSGIACSVSPTFFSTLGMRTLAGRLPRAEEISSESSLVVITRSLAARLFGTASMAVGSQVDIDRTGWKKRRMDVIGVVDDIGDGLLGFTPDIVRVQNVQLRQSAGFLVRARRESQSVIKDVASALRSADPRITVSDMTTAADAIRQGRLKSRGRALFLACVAMLSVTLAVIGVFSLTAYSTTLRAREFGIRMALGATPRRLAWLVLGELRWSALIGVAAGLLASVKLTTWLDAVVRPVYMTTPLVTLPLAAVSVSSIALVLIVTLGAGVPLRRVLRMDVARSLSG